MTENVTPPPVNPFMGVTKAAGDAQQAIKILEAPPEAVSKGVVEGRVVSQENGRVTIATDQGPIILEAKIAAEIGQKIRIRLNLVAQDIAQKLAVENLSDKTGVETGKAPERTASVTYTDRVQTMQPSQVKTFEALQARLVALPQAVTKETFEILSKSMLQLPLSRELPQTLQEGFTKFQQLTDLLVQAKLVPQQSLQAATAQTRVQNDMLTSLLQILTPPPVGGQEQGGKNTFWNQNTLGFLQLQTIAPGQNLSPNILLDIRRQLMNVLQLPQMTQNTTPLSNMLSGLVKQTQGLFNTLVPSSLQQAVQQGVQNMLGQTSVAHTPTQNTPLFTLPMTGIVLGQSPTPLMTPQGMMSAGSLVLMATPQGQNLVGFISQSAIPNPTPAQMIIPGTVIVMAMPPQAQNSVNLPSMIGMLPTLSPEALQALHPAFGKDWPALDDIWLEALTQQATQPELLGHLRQVLPSPTPQHMTPAMLLFLALVKGGFGEQILDDKAQDILQKLGKAKAVGQLLQDMGAIRQAMDDGGAEAWKPLPLPMQNNDQLMRVQWHYRHQYDDFGGQGGEDSQNNKTRKTRFIVDVPQTKLGDIQIDGFVHEKNLDIVLRTETPMMKYAENAIRERYLAALEISGMAGQLQFQTGRDHYVQVG